MRRRRRRDSGHAFPPVKCQGKRSGRDYEIGNQDQRALIKGNTQCGARAEARTTLAPILGRRDPVRSQRGLCHSEIRKP